MSKIHDWTRAYWRNASGDREFFMADDLEEGDVPESTLCIYRNEHDDEVAYELSPTETVETEVEVTEEVENDEGETEEVTSVEVEEEEVYQHGAKYIVSFNGEVLSGEQVTEVLGDSDIVELEDGEDVPDTAAFGSRGQAREFSAAWRRRFGSPDDLGYTIQVDEVDPEEFEVGDLSTEELREGLNYDEVVDLAKQHGIKASQSHDALAAQLSGEDEPELTQAAMESDEEEEAEEAEASD